MVKLKEEKMTEKILTWRTSKGKGKLAISWKDFEKILDFLAVPNLSHHDRITLFEDGELRLYLGPDILFKCKARMM